MIIPVSCLLLATTPLLKVDNKSAYAIVLIISRKKGNVNDIGT